MIVLLNSRALTKIQSIVLICTIIVVALGGSLVYVLLNGEATSETIKIGVLADLDTVLGENNWQGAVLAAEQLNDEGGIMGKQIKVVGEDTDSSSGGDAAKFNLALTRLLAYHEVDFIIGVAADKGFMVQDLIAKHERVFFEISSNEDEYTQRVLEDYNTCKYFFRVGLNATSMFHGVTDSLVHVREMTGFSRVGYLREDLGWTKGIIEGLDYVLPEVYGFDLVYKGKCPLETVDFSSYFAAAEAAGVEVLMPYISGLNGIPFVKEYHDRQSPMVVFGGFLNSMVAGPEGWINTDGKCEYISNVLWPMEAGYPLTSKTLPVRDAYIDRWGEIPDFAGSATFNVLRYILPDAIERAGTLDVDAVIKALETTSMELTSSRKFVFTSSHDGMVGENPNDPEEDYMLVLIFQWQNGELIPVYPKKIMEEAGATYIYPDWPGPWD